MSKLGRWMMMCGMLTTTAAAEIVSEPIAYRDGGVELEGYLAYDEAVTEPRPAVIVVHEWWGLNDFAKAKARQLAEMGYVAFALDMYGKGIVTDDPKRAGELAGQIGSDKEKYRARAKAAYEVVAADARVDKERIGAMGFCFGGTTVLHMAYSGLKLRGVVSFHGGPVEAGEEDAKRLNASILFLHGAADTLIPEEALAKFQKSLEHARADYQILIFGGAKHSFTNPAADALGMAGVGYDARAERRSFAEMKRFFAEVFAAN